MEKVILIIKTVASLVPVIIQILKTLEEAFPEGGKGAEKLEIAKTMLESSFNQMQNVSVSFLEIWPTVQAVIAKLVALYNSLGIFKKSS